jgi:hypothetical protein
LVLWIILEKVLIYFLPTDLAALIKNLILSTV